MTSMITSPKEPEYIEKVEEYFLQDDFSLIVRSGSALEHAGFNFEEGTPERQPIQINHDICAITLIPILGCFMMKKL